MRRIIIILILIVLVSLTVRPAEAIPISVYFRHDALHDSPTGKASEYFKRLVEQRSGKRVQVQISLTPQSPGGALLNEALADSRLQMIVACSSNLMALDQQLQLFDLPFLFRDENHRRRIIDGEVGQAILQSASRGGLKALAFWDGGFRQLTTNRSLATPEDLRGLNIGIVGTEPQKAQFAALGANAISIAHAQRFGALAGGRLDSQESSFEIIVDQKLYEVQTDLLISNHSFEEHLVLVNTTFWQQVPEDLRVIIRGAINDAAIYAREMAVENNRVALEKIRRLNLINVHELTDSERSLWRMSMESLYQTFATSIGPNLLQEALAAEPQ